MVFCQAASLSASAAEHSWVCVAECICFEYNSEQPNLDISFLNEFWNSTATPKAPSTHLRPAFAAALPWLVSWVVRRGWELVSHSVLSELALDRVGVDAVPLKADGCAVQDSDFNVSGCSPGICNVLGQRAGYVGRAGPRPQVPRGLFSAARVSPPLWTLDTL